MGDEIRNHIDNKKTIVDEMIKNQLPNLSETKKLKNKDMLRIVENINTSLFDKTNCCLWENYVTNDAKSKRGAYVNFFFRGKKTALHRLLYENFVGELKKSYLKFNCQNNGKCCNINHMSKHKYNAKKNIDENELKHENDLDNSSTSSSDEEDAEIDANKFKISFT